MIKSPFFSRKNQKKSFVEGILSFENTKILLRTPQENFFIIPPSLSKNLVSGDKIRAKICQKKSP